MSGPATSVLPILCDGDAPVARQGQRIISRGAFLAEIQALAVRLPERPYVVNFCSDRYRFTVAWAAAMLRGQITLLPAGRDAGAVAALRADYEALYVLADDDQAADWPAPYFAYPDSAWPAPGARAPGREGGGAGIPAFPPDQVAAVLFTSGSTGRPHASPRSWGRLVAGSLAAGAALGVARFPGAPLVATVPHAHSYGLESAVMLPLQLGLTLTAERPFFPADVAAALNRDDRPCILVTTPVHLRALVEDALVGDGARDGARPGIGASFRAGFVLSATAPLSADLAVRAEAAFGAPVFEIYGCSEAGQLATRRTVHGPVWRCLDGFRLYNDAAGSWAAGPGEPDVRLADEIEPDDAGGFVLLGRTADLVNVAGKRSSLAYLTAQLLAIDGVEDGVFLMPDEGQGGASSRPDAAGATPQPGTAGATPRLAAVVLAPGLTAVTILAALRERIDAAFLPRPLHVVDTLPRNELGKLPRAEVLRLIAQTPPRVAAVRPGPVNPAAANPAAANPAAANPATANPGPVDPEAARATAANRALANPASTNPSLATDPSGGRAPTLLHFAQDHPAGPGHFPGNPVVPGAVLLDELVAALFPGPWSGSVESVKFHHPVRPGDTVALTHRTDGETTRFEGRLAQNETRVLSGVLRTPFPPR
jgi:acyl-coenzyme A synthetase/AMP-(fatty) acid ligase/acyl dehydratase